MLSVDRFEKNFYIKMRNKSLISLESNNTLYLLTNKFETILDEFLPLLDKQ